MALFVGVISGTSVDGIDTVLMDLEADKLPQLIVAKTFSYPENIKQAIVQLIDEPQCGLQLLGELDMALGQVYAEAVLNLLQMANYSAADITCIGCHGQTIFHAPYATHPFSMQIGNANLIAEITGITTVSDMRQRDMVCGGQGAPMVPGFHEVMFRQPTEDRVIVNIGGIANITILPADNNQPILGFDTGPGNTLMDAWISKVLGKAYDTNGEWAATGKCQTDLLAKLLDDPFFSLPIPKSSGRELFHLDWLMRHLAKFTANFRPEDVQATLLELTSKTIADAIHQYAPNNSRIIICGGGAHNASLLQAICRDLSPLSVDTTNQHGLDVDFVEACAFAWLASRTLNRQTGSLASVTGARHDSILGGVYWSS